MRLFRKRYRIIDYRQKQKRKKHKQIALIYLGIFFVIGGALITTFVLRYQHHKEETLQAVMKTTNEIQQENKQKK